MKMNKRISAMFVLLAVGALAVNLQAEPDCTPQEAALQALAINKDEFCGNTPGRDIGAVLREHGLDDRAAGLAFAQLVAESLQVEPPRPAETNGVCSRALLALCRFHVPEAAASARQAFLDPSREYEFEALRAYFACETNEQSLAGFTSVVWSNTTAQANSKRLSFSIATLGWLEEGACLTAEQKNTLYAQFSQHAEREARFSVAVRLDKILLLLKDDYCSSATRTNLIIRFKGETAAKNDPRYFRRLADAMGLD